MDTQRQSPEFYDDVKAKYVGWLAMAPAERTAMRLPRSKAKFAELHGVSERTLRLWDPQVKDEVEELKVRKVVQSGGHLAHQVDDIENMSNAELFADIIRRQLVSAARGDSDAMNFLRSNQAILKPLMDALNEDFQSDFEAASDDELVGRFLDGFETEAVLALRSRGWSVEKMEVEV